MPVLLLHFIISDNGERDGPTDSRIAPGWFYTDRPRFPTEQNGSNNHRLLHIQSPVYTQSHPPLYALPVPLSSSPFIAYCFFW